MREQYTPQKIGSLLPNNLRVLLQQKREHMSEVYTDIHLPHGGKVFKRGGVPIIAAENDFLTGLTTIVNNIDVLRVEASHAIPPDTVGLHRRSIASNLVQAIHILATDKVHEADQRYNAEQFLSLAYVAAIAAADLSVQHSGALAGTRSISEAQDLVLDHVLPNSPFPSPRQIAFLTLYPEVFHTLQEQGIPLLS